jgi:hypothetical protein
MNEKSPLYVAMLEVMGLASSYNLILSNHLDSEEANKEIEAIKETLRMIHEKANRALSDERLRLHGNSLHTKQVEEEKERQSGEKKIEGAVDGSAKEDEVNAVAGEETFTLEKQEDPPNLYLHLQDRHNKGPAPKGS